MTKLLLLHGALGAKSQFAGLEKILSRDFEVYSINFSGHGGEQIPSEPFSMKMLAEDILKFLAENEIEKINIFGYSMGGYAALYLAKTNPARVGKIFTLATKFEWSEAIAAREAKMLDAAKIKEKIPKFAKELQIRHSPQDWETVLQKTSGMMINLGRKNELTFDDLSAIENEVQLGLGDSDKMVTIEETAAVYHALKNCKMIIFPNTTHPLEQVDIEMLKAEINLFFRP